MMLRDRLLACIAEEIANFKAGSLRRSGPK